MITDDSTGHQAGAHTVTSEYLRGRVLVQIPQLQLRLRMLPQDARVIANQLLAATSSLPEASPQPQLQPPPRLPDDAALAMFEAGIVRRALFAAAHNHGRPAPEWSTGEQLAVALVTGDDETFRVSGYSRPQALQRLAADLTFYGYTGTAENWLAEIRAAADAPPVPGSERWACANCSLDCVGPRPDNLLCPGCTAASAFPPAPPAPAPAAPLSGAAPVMPEASR